MIIGQVNVRLEAEIDLFVEDISGQACSIKAGIDTGYSGYLSLRPTIIQKLGLPWITKRVFLLNGTTIHVDVYSGVVIWDSQARIVDIHAVEMEPLVGMRMLAGNEIRIHVVNGDSVWIDRSVNGRHSTNEVQR